MDKPLSTQVRREPWRAALYILFVLLPVAAAGQQPQEPPPNAAQSQPTTTTLPATPTPSLTLSDLQLQLKQVQEAVDLPEETKTKAVAAFTQAIQQFEIAEQWAARAAEYEAERQKAPETLRAIQAELATPLGEPTPDVPPDATRADLEQRLRQVQSDLDAEKKALADWERERDRRTARRREIPDLLTAAKSRLQAVTETPTSPEAEQSAIARLAQQSLSQARRLGIEREIEAYNGELLSYDARRDLLQARLDRATRRVGHLDKLVSAWQRLVQERAQHETELALREAREQLKRAHPAIRPYAEEREHTALRAKEMQAAIKEVDGRFAEADATLTQLNQDFEKITRRVNATGLTNAIGQLLRKHRGSLPSLRPLERNLRLRKDAISSVQLAMMELDDRRTELVDAEAHIAQVLETLAPSETVVERENVRQAAAETIASLRGDVDVLVKDYDRYFDKLVDLDSKERDLVAKIEQFDSYVDEKILWIKSGTLPGSRDLQNGRDAVGWFLNPAGWRSIPLSVWGTTRANPVSGPIGLVAVIVLWLATPRLLRVVRVSGDLISKPTKAGMRLTLRTLMATALLAIRWPAVFWLAAWAIASPYNASDFCKAVGGGLRAVAVIALTLHALRQLARSDGLAERHFRWNTVALKALKRHIHWLTLTLVPAIFVVATLELQELESAKNSLGRLAFMVAFLAIATFVQRFLRPSGPVFNPSIQKDPGSLLYRLRYLWYLIALVTPLALVAAAALGYYYTALYLGRRFLESIWLLFILVILRALVERWLLYLTRERAIAEARARAAQRAQQQETPAPAETSVFVVHEEKLDVTAINKQTLQLVRTVLVVAGVIGIWGIWADALPALGVLREIPPLWTITQQVSETVPTADGGTQINEHTTEIPVTLANLGLAVLVAFITFVAVKNVPGLLEITILQRLPIDAGGRFAVTAVTRYTITVAGVIIAFAQIGVGWAKVQWLVAAMTVGLGFGLQEIFANLVSGLMLLLERPIRIGDTVTVGDTSGTVARIRTRATTIVGWDRKELIIPNKEFITGNVVNWTLSDSTLRVIVPVGIAYGSDTRLAREVLARIAREYPNALADPPPRIVFRSFGDSSLNFELRVYIGSIDLYLTTIDELHEIIDQEFRKAGIEIAFPQRDIHVRSIREALPVVNAPAEADLPKQT